VEALTLAVLPGAVRSALEGRLPEWLEPRWWDSPETMVALAPSAEIGWFDMHFKPPVLRSIELARGLKWLNTSYAGVDWMPLADFVDRGVTVTCGCASTRTLRPGLSASSNSSCGAAMAGSTGEWFRPDPVQMPRRAVPDSDGATGVANLSGAVVRR
jgi:hypothetical protein